MIARPPIYSRAIPRGATQRQLVQMALGVKAERPRPAFVEHDRPNGGRVR